MSSVYYARNDERPDLGKQLNNKLGYKLMDGGKAVDTVAEGFDQDASFFSMILHEPFNLELQIPATEMVYVGGVPTLQVIKVSPRYQFQNAKSKSDFQFVSEILEKDSLLLIDGERFAVDHVDQSGQIWVMHRGVNFVRTGTPGAYVYEDIEGSGDPPAGAKFHKQNSEVKLIVIDFAEGGMVFAADPADPTMTCYVTRSWSSGELGKKGIFRAEFDLATTDSPPKTTAFPRPDQEPLLVYVDVDLENR